MFGLLAQTTTTTTSTGLGAGGAALIAGGVVRLLRCCSCSMIASMWKIFDKAGQKGWLAIIPILNIVVLLKVVHKELWWIILLLIPCVNIVASIIVYFGLAKAFGKGARLRDRPDHPALVHLRPDPGLRLVAVRARARPALLKASTVLPGV